jgi:hypothetical protein
MALIAVFALASAGLSPASAAIFGKDSRRPVPQSFRAASDAVGTLRAPGRGSINECNAVCVSPHVIATSAHCLYFPVRNGSLPRLPAVSFRNAKGRSTIAGAAQGHAAWNVIAGATFVSKRKNWTVSRDWALARLATPVCQGASLDIVTKNKWGDLFDKVLERKIFIISQNRYGSRLRLEFADACDKERNALELGMQWLAIDLGSREPEHLIPHRCDFKRGASGSPLLLEEDGKVKVLAINAAESDGRILTDKLGKAIASQVNANFAVSSKAFASQIGLLEKQRAPMARQSVRALQTGLARLELYSATPDGAFGRRTRQAILDFERRYGMTITGLPSPGLLAAVSAAVTAPEVARDAVIAYFKDPSTGPNAALAIDPITGVVGQADGSDATPAEAAESALAACRNIGGDCRIFALGDEVVFEPDDASNAAPTSPAQSR